MQLRRLVLVVLLVSLLAGAVFVYYSFQPKEVNDGVSIRSRTPAIQLDDDKYI